ncbi:hypothetical protein [Actinoplanes subtropicus]|uniref:hypothetical protein n=1 Tax=Actinoplanes subtropicus TaxID=543632 RepID=UPI000A977AFB|nr:hypothetical protein [Actinoplanes subtropicus]
MLKTRYRRRVSWWQHDGPGEGDVHPPNLGDDQRLALLDFAEEAAQEEEPAESDEDDDNQDGTTGGDSVHQ